MDVFLEVSPFSTQDLWSTARVTIKSLVTSLSKALLPQRVLEVPNFFLLRIMEATVLLGTFNAAGLDCSLNR